MCRLSMQRSAPSRTAFFRKSVRKTEMCAVGFIHDQRNPLFMNQSGNGCNIRNNAVIRGRSDHHRRRIRKLPQPFFHLPRQNAPLNPEICGFRIQVFHPQLHQIRRVINRLMAVAPPPGYGHPFSHSRRSPPAGRRYSRSPDRSSHPPPPALPAAPALL